MQTRFRIADLPKTASSRACTWQISCEIAGERSSHPLEADEVCVGSSTQAGVRIQAPGVRGRHLRIKSSGGKVYVQPLGNAAVIANGSLVRGLTELNPEEPFSFGSVTARLEAVVPEDRIEALSIPGVRVPVGIVDGPASTDGAASALAFLNDLFEEHLRGGAPPVPERLLEALERCHAPVSAALYRIEDGECSVAAERTRHGAPPAEALGSAEDCRTYRWGGAHAAWELRVLYSERGSPAWQDEVARHVLLLAALNSRPGPEAPAAPVLHNAPDGWHRFVGAEIRAELGRSTEMCRCSDTVLVLGETGTGKELAARSLHELWARSGEFVALNCAAVPGDLLDAEFFGIEPGTATGVSAQRGRIEQARGGTLFLDEISEMPLALQSKLLRVLQEREYFRLGGARLLKAEVKIVAASNHPEEYLRGGKMREDLFFRLAQAKLVLSPLRTRTPDIAALCEHFLGEFEARWRHGVRGASLSALEALKAHAWPGNVRELQNVLRAAYVEVPRGGLIQRMHLPAEVRSASPARVDGTLTAIVDRVEREAIERELARHERVGDAARALGVSESYLYRLMKKKGMPRKGAR